MSSPLAGLAVWDHVPLLLVSMNKYHCVMKIFQKQNVCCVCQIGCSFRSGSTLPTPHSSFPFFQSPFAGHRLGSRPCGMECWSLREPDLQEAAWTRSGVGQAQAQCLGLGSAGKGHLLWRGARALF